MALVNTNHSAFLHAIAAAAAAAADADVGEGAKPSNDRARYHAIITASRPSFDPLEEQ